MSRTMRRLVCAILLLGAAAGVALALLGWWLHPAISLLSFAAAAFTFALYGLTAILALDRLLPSRSVVSSVALAGGIVAGVIFCAEIILENVVLPKDNSTWGQVEFGAVFLIYFIVALMIAARDEPLGNSAIGAVIAAMISSILWCVCLLTMFYLFEGSARQTSVLLAEGDFDDFRRSGLSSFSTFEMEDLFGASFFHLLLGPIIAAIGGCMAWTATRAWKLLIR